MRRSRSPSPSGSTQAASVSRHPLARLLRKHPLCESSAPRLGGPSSPTTISLMRSWRNRSGPRRGGASPGARARAEVPAPDERRAHGPMARAGITADRDPLTSQIPQQPHRQPGLKRASGASSPILGALRPGLEPLPYPPPGPAFGARRSPRWRSIGCRREEGASRGAKWSDQGRRLSLRRRAVVQDASRLGVRGPRRPVGLR